ncbi:MAG: THUMP domain-containing protein [Candidatus Woesearchaeota archaeon]
MHGLIITHDGIEDIAVTELKELIGAKGTIENGVVVFKFRCILDLYKLSYCMQSVRRVLLLIAEFEVKPGLLQTMALVEKALKKAEIEDIKDMRIKTECVRQGAHDFTSLDLATEIGKLILAKAGRQSKLQVDMKNPQLVFHVFVNNGRGYLGIDTAGFDLSKRDYRLMDYRPPLKANIAYGLLRMCGYNKDAVLVNPFCSAGVMSIEAAFFAINKPVNYYRKHNFLFKACPQLEGEDIDGFFEKIDREIGGEPRIFCVDEQLRHISAAKKNSKIAGVHKQITFSKIAVEWLDTKFDEGSVDCVVCNAPRLSQFNEGQMAKVYKEFFYQAAYILRNEGKVGLVCNRSEQIKKSASEHNFMLIEERSVWQGKEELKLLVFKK